MRLGAKVRAVLPSLLPPRWRHARASAAIRRAYAPQVAAARAAGDRDELQHLEGSEDHELGMLDEEEAARYTRHLLRKAARLRVPVPRRATDDAEPTGYWTRGDRTGASFLTDAGEERLREDLRKEVRWRRETRAHWLPFVTAVTGALGTAIGLLSLLAKRP